MTPCFDNVLRPSRSSCPKTTTSQHGHQKLHLRSQCRRDASLLVQLRRPHPPLFQNRVHHLHIPRNKPDPKIPRNSHQRTLNSIVVHVISIRRIRHTSLNPIQAEQTKQRSVDELACYQSTRTGSRASAEGEVRDVRVGSRCVEGRCGGRGCEPAFGVEGCGGGTKVVCVCGLLGLYSCSGSEHHLTMIPSLSVDQHHRPLRYNRIAPPDLAHCLTR